MSKAPKKKPSGWDGAVYSALFDPARWKRRGKQTAAGLHENITANVNAPGEIYKPALISQVLSIPAVVKSLTDKGQQNLGKGGKPFSGNTIIERALNEAFDEVDVAEKAGNKIAGTTSAENLEDLFFRHGVLGLVNPAAAGRAALKVAPKVVKGAAKSAAKTGSKVAKAVPKPARVATNVAHEVLTPFRSGSLGIAAPVTAGILGAVDVASDQSPTLSGGTYEGSIPKAYRAIAGQPEPLGAPDDEEALAMQQIQLEALQDAIDNDEITEEELQEYENTPFSEEEVEGARADDSTEKWKQGGAWLAAVLGATVGGHKFRKYSEAKIAERVKAAEDPANVGKFGPPEDYMSTEPIQTEPIVRQGGGEEPTGDGAPEFTGTKFEKSDLSGFDKFVTEGFEQHKPIVAAADKHLGRNHAKKYGFRADRMTNSSIQSKFVDWLATGRAPGTEMKTEKLSSWAEAYANNKELSDVQRAEISDALLGASALDDFYRTGNRAALTKNKFGQPVSVKETEALVARVRQDPVMGKYFNQVQKFFDQKLQFEVQRGTMTKEAYDKMREERPNYVPLQSNLQEQAPFSPFGQRYSANEELNQQRNIDTETGVPGDTGVVNPFSLLFEDWSDAVRRAETNDFRRDFLRDMADSGAKNRTGQLLVKEVSEKNTGPNVHKVNTPDGTKFYEVLDSELARSLHFAPRNVVPLFESARQTFQSMTTGALGTLTNNFAYMAAPIMDSMAASTLQGKAHTVGAANKLFAGGHIGGVRAAGGLMAREMAIKARKNMIRENSWLKSALGDKGAEALTDRLEKFYEQTFISQMDQMGITSHAAYGAKDPTHIMEGLETIVPGFARTQSKAISSDVQDALNNGDINHMKAAMLKSGNAKVRAKTWPVLRHYGHLIEGLHNGARTSAVAANKGKVKDLDQFVSDMRRASADPSLHGANKWVDYGTSMQPYAPIAMQTLAQAGKRLREDPVNFTTNYLRTMTTAAALFYFGQAYSQEARDAHARKTPQQKANKLTMFGGVELPLDQMVKLGLGSVLPILDEISGVNDGKINPDFLEVMENWLEGDESPIDENNIKDWELRMNEAARANMPVTGIVPKLNIKPGGKVDVDIGSDLGSIPLLGGIAAHSLGIDPGMSRITGEPVAPKIQDLVGLDEGERRPGSMVSSATDVAIRTLFSSAGGGLLDAADEAYRALNDKDPDNDKRAWEMALDSWKETSQRGAGLAKGLFGDRKELKSASNVDYALLKDREKGIEAAANFLIKDVRTGSYSGASRSTGHIARELDPSGIAGREELDGTEALRIGSSARQMITENTKTKQALKQISAQIESIHAATDKTKAEKNELIAPLVDEIKYRRMMMLQRIREHENTISNDIGRRFSFEDYNGADYVQPLKPR